MDILKLAQDYANRADIKTNAVDYLQQSLDSQGVKMPVFQNTLYTLNKIPDLKLVGLMPGKNIGLIYVSEKLKNMKGGLNRENYNHDLYRQFLLSPFVLHYQPASFDVKNDVVEAMNVEKGFRFNWMVHENNDRQVLLDAIILSEK
ncbi:MAG: hypothetical protein ABIB43_00505 [archaeon]